MTRTTKSMTICLILTVAMGLQLIASQNRVDLETRIERVILSEHGFEIGEIERLASRSAIRDVLLRMVTKYRNAEPDTETGRDFVLLGGAVFALGQLKEKQALEPLLELLADRNLAAGTRYCAAQALGKIDADASKDVLLRSLDSDNHISLRLAAVEALGNARGAAVLDSLQRHLETEQRDSLRRRATESIRRIRSRIQ